MVEVGLENQGRLHPELLIEKLVCITSCQKACVTDGCLPRTKQIRYTVVLHGKPLKKPAREIVVGDLLKNLDNTQLVSNLG